MRAAPRKNEVKQQQDWRSVFVDRLETYGITDRLDELMGENVGFDRDLMSRSICACLSEISPEVRLRRVQTGPELGMASLAQRIAEEEVSSDSECSLCTIRSATASTKGGKSLIEGGNFHVLISARCRMGSTDMRCCILPNTACWLPALSLEQGGRCNDRKEALACCC